MQFSPVSEMSRHSEVRTSFHYYIILSTEQSVCCVLSVVSGIIEFVTCTEAIAT